LHGGVRGLARVAIDISSKNLSDIFRLKPEFQSQYFACDMKEAVKNQPKEFDVLFELTLVDCFY
jgi:hypothetical protein